MSSGSVSLAFKERPNGPYAKALRVKVVATDDPYEYKAKDGSVRKVLTAACSDGVQLCKLLCYDAAKFKSIKVGQTLVARDTIRRTEDGRPTLVFTSATKVFNAAPIDIPADHFAEGATLVNPPPAKEVTVVEALRSPAKSKSSIRGRVVQEDEKRTVEVRGEDVAVKSITVEDESGSAKVTLWRACTSADVRPGDHVVITDLVTNTYQNKTTLSTTTKSQIQKQEAPEVVKQVVVEGICVNEDKAELYLGDDTILNVNTELLQTALATEEQSMPDLEQATSEGPLNLRVTCKGSEILDVEKI